MESEPQLVGVPRRGSVRMTDLIPDEKSSRQPYERPRLVVYGSVEALTKTGTAGADEAGSQTGNKKRTSLL